MIPRGDLAEEFLGTRRQLGRVLQPEVAVDALNQAEQRLDFGADLLLGHEAVAIVLRKLADARQARQHARRFVAVQRRLLVEAERQVLVAAHLAGEQQEVARAVHRLEAHVLAIGRLHEEHVLAVVLPVAGRFPQRLVEDDGRLDFDVAGRERARRACSCRACCRASSLSASQNVAPGAHG